ncbi:GlyGly-CTERM sorting domain-containing protein [Agrobacterium tumefaciens]
MGLLVPSGTMTVFGIALLPWIWMYRKDYSAAGGV